VRPHQPLPDLAQKRAGLNLFAGICKNPLIRKLSFPLSRRYCQRCRELATLEAASARAIQLAGRIIRRDCYRRPDLDTLTCSVEVTMFDLRPFRDVAWTLEDGTKVFLTEAERPLPFGWAWHR
jgi:hypothetical protein